MYTQNQALERIKTIGIVIIAICSILLVIQGFGGGTQDVYVRGGSQDVYVSGGSIDATVSGSVDIDNTVDVNLYKVIGYPVGCHKSYTIGGREYQAIDVTIR